MRRLVFPILGIVAIVAIGAAVYFRAKFTELKANPQKIAQDESAALVARVKAIMVLPEDEQPTIATVADPSKLQEQPFFARAKVGDKVLLYTNARKAILYDPANNKIVEVAPISIGNPPTAAAPAAPAPQATAPANKP